MSKHTPGPWKWDGHWLIGDGEIVLWYTTDDNGVHSKPEDARLIAAAPAMLEALKEAEAGLEIACQRNPIVGDFTPSEHLALRIVRAAIAKATGEQP